MCCCCRCFKCRTGAADHSVTGGCLQKIIVDVSVKDVSVVNVGVTVNFDTGFNYHSMTVVEVCRKPL